MRRKQIAALMAGVPEWVRAKYGAAGVVPDVVADFAGDRYWDRRFGQQPLAQMFNIVRASEACADDTSGRFGLFPPGVIARTSRGLHAWESSTNSLRNNTMQGASVGGDLLPANWGYDTASGVGRNIVGLGTENGMDYIDVQFVSPGAASAAAMLLSMDAATQIAAASGQTWTFSVWLKLVAGDFTNLATFQGHIQEVDGGGLELFNNAATVSGVNSGTYVRHVQTATLGQATTAFARPQLVFVPSGAGVGIDVTIRIAWPQLEQKAYVTPPIRTTTAAVTRGADVVTMADVPAFGSSWSMFSAARTRLPITAATSQVVLQVSDSAANNRTPQFRNNGNGQARHATVVGGATLFNLTGAIWNQDTFGKHASACSDSDTAFAFNGAAAVGSAVTYTPFLPNTVSVGCRGAGTQQLDGEVTDLALWSRARIPNAALQAITA